jgi:hypothetical protein
MDRFGHVQDRQQPIFYGQRLELDGLSNGQSDQRRANRRENRDATKLDIACTG